MFFLISFDIRFHKGEELVYCLLTQDHKLKEPEMLQKQKLRWLLVGGLFFISLGGWILHMRIHPPLNHAANSVPFVVGLISFTAVAAMFLSRKTLAYAYVVNGMLVIIGTITMTHYSVAKPPEEITFASLISKTLFPDILILFTNFMLGKVLFELEILKTEETGVRKGRFFRYPNMGWWLVHLAALSGVYLVGHLFWK